MSEKFNGVEPNRGRNGWGDFELMIETLESGLKKSTWILGRKFTAADIMVGSSAVFMRMFDMLPKSSAIDAYADRCLKRHAYQKALSIEKT
jgi:glutathione S-transferase